MEILGECPMTTFSSCNIMPIQRIKGTNLLMISFTSQSTRFTIVPKITRFISKFFTRPKKTWMCDQESAAPHQRASSAPRTMRYMDPWMQQTKIIKNLILRNFLRRPGTKMRTLAWVRDFIHVPHGPRSTGCALVRCSGFLITHSCFLRS